MGRCRLTRFAHERLDVYRVAILFVAWAHEMAEDASPGGPMKDQLARAAASVPLNIAEGNAKYSGRERRRYFETARASALECAACLDVLVARGKTTDEQVDHGKDLLDRIVAMLTSMIKGTPDRIAEPEADYALHGAQSAATGIDRDREGDRDRDPCCRRQSE